MHNALNECEINECKLNEYEQNEFKLNENQQNKFKLNEHKLNEYKQNECELNECKLKECKLVSSESVIFSLSSNTGPELSITGYRLTTKKYRSVYYIISDIYSEIYIYDIIFEYRKRKILILNNL